ncbi:MAG: hypothetical protein GF309_06925 [Candidatus Lokiarchaeota archaeon]|nr:hypothetical protein [Candidatus Lokiarchaeota archaeon]
MKDRPKLWEVIFFPGLALIAVLSLPHLFAYYQTGRIDPFLNIVSSGRAVGMTVLSILTAIAWLVELPRGRKSEESG